MHRFNKTIYIIATLLLLIALLLWFQELWLPLIPLQFGAIQTIVEFIEAHSGFLEGLAVISGALLFIWNTLKGLLSQPNDTEKNIMLFTTVEKIQDELGKWGSKVNWVDRLVVQVEDLRMHRRVALLGAMKVGKSREAVELIKRAIENDLIADGDILVPGYGIAIAKQKTIESFLRKELYGKSSVLIFIDDLPQHFNGVLLENIGTVLRVADCLCSKTFTITTVRLDQLRSDHNDWLKKNSFNEVQIVKFNYEQAALLVQNTVDAFDLKITVDIVSEIAKNSDGTAEHIISALRRLNATDTPFLTPESAQTLMQQETRIMWWDNRRIIEREQPLARELIKVLSFFYYAGLRPYKNIVTAVLAMGWIKQHNLSHIFSFAKNLQASIAYLSNFDIVAGDQAFSAPEAAFETISVLEAQSGIGKWLLTQDNLWSKILLAVVFRALDEYHVTLFVLERVGRRHPNYDQELFARLQSRKSQFINRLSKELERLTEPTPLSVMEIWQNEQNRRLIIYEPPNNISSLPQRSTYIHYYYPQPKDYVRDGFNLLNSGKSHNAIIAFNQAIKLQPRDSVAHYGLSWAYWNLGKVHEAVQECREAVKLNPAFSRAHHDLGCFLLELRNLEEAKLSFEKSLELEPTFSPSIRGIILTKLFLKETEDALSFLHEAVDRIPDDKHLSMLLEWLTITLDDNTFLQNIDKYYQLILTYLPQITELLITTSPRNLQRQFRDARELMALLLDIDVDSITLWDGIMIYGILNYAEGKSTEAINLFQRANKLEPGKALSLIMLGKSYQLASTPRAAEKYFREALNQDITNVLAYIGVAQCQVLLGRPSEALETSSHIVADKEWSLEGHILLALAYSKLSDARKLSEQLAIINRIENLTSFDQARVAAIIGNNEHAIELVRETVNMDASFYPEILIDPCFDKLKETKDFKQTFELLKGSILLGSPNKLIDTLFEAPSSTEGSK